MCYSINAAINSNLIDQVVLSSDSAEFLKIGSDFGAYGIERPKKLSTDSAKTIDVIKHVIEYMTELNQIQKYDIITILQPTSPLRTTKEIDASIFKLIRTGADCVLGVQESKNNPCVSFKIKNKKLEPLQKDFLKFHQHQLFPKIYYPTGSIYTFWTDNLKKYGERYGKKIVPLIIKGESIDIDTEFDLVMAEKLLLNSNQY